MARTPIFCPLVPQNLLIFLCIIDNIWHGIYLSNDCDNNTISGNNADNPERDDQDNGIYLENNCDNNTISGNIANNNRDYGIFLEGNCVNNTISGNTVITNDWGIHLRNNCNINTISGNTAHDNGQGILLWKYCNNNTISGNTAYDTLIGFSQSNGIRLWVNCCYNTISGNTLYDNHGNGISFKENCSDNNIFGNTAKSINIQFPDVYQSTGIHIEMDCNRNTISENIVINNLNNGIVMEESSNNIIFGNTIRDNGWNLAGYNGFGIRLYKNCDDNTISGNNVSNDGTTYQNMGVYLSVDCSNNTISGNIINGNNEYGIYLRENCNNNTIRGNTINDNFQAGIRFYGEYWSYCNNNIITRNLIKNNQNYGIHIVQNCHNNLFYQNSLIGTSGWHAHDGGTNNYWNNSAIGNYWDNHTSPDSDHNGIVDTSYKWINGSTNSEDYFPLVQSPIYIGDKIYVDDYGISAPNWSRTAELNLWCNGSGTYSDPYIIDGLEIDGNGGICIEIINSDVPFILRNNFLFNYTLSVYAIKMLNANNSIIYKNDLSETYAGLKLENCHNNTISENIIETDWNYVNHGHLILLKNSNKNRILNNSLNNTNNRGIMFYENDDNNVISGNSISNTAFGITMWSGSGNNNITLNNITFNGDGIQLSGSDFDDGNYVLKNFINNNTRSGIFAEGARHQIINNTIANNGEGGIDLSNRNNCIVSGNNISNNGNYGIILDNTNDMIISENIFENNPIGIQMISGNNNLVDRNNINNYLLKDISIGILISNALTDSNITENLMIKCGIRTSSIDPSNIIDETNKVNSKFFYYYRGEDGLNLKNFTNAGQILLDNCNNSLISNIDVSYSTDGIKLISCNNISIFNCNSSFNFNGFFVVSGSNNTITNNNCSYNGENGISLEVMATCHYNNISENIIYGNGNGGIIVTGNNNTISKNTVRDNANYGIALYKCESTLVLGNNISYNKYGLYLNFSCKFNTISGNMANNNTQYGIYLENNCNNNTISGNIINDNDNYGISISNGIDNFIIQNNLTSSTSGYYREVGTCYNIYSLNLCNGNYSSIAIDNTGRYGHTWDFLVNLLLQCSGTGIWSDPYVLEDLEFNCQGVGCGILIQNSKNVYFFIDSCIVSNSGGSTEYAGIKLENTNNGSFINNNCSNNGRYGILFRNYCENNTVSGNNISDNTQYGIYLENNCNNNTIMGNAIRNNAILGLVITNLADGNLVYNNNFTNNGIHAQDDCSYNRWDNGTIGNYWHDYSGVDADDDGIGDTPYIVSGTAGSQDNYPIWDDGPDNKPPMITIISPEAYEQFGINAPNFIVEIQDPNLEYMWYTLNGGIVKYFFKVNGTINQTAWDILSEGIITIRFFANDTIGNLNYTDIIVVKILPWQIKDTYVDSGDPTSNFGGVNALEVGRWFGDQMEAYFYFPFTDKPANYIKAEIQIYAWGVTTSTPCDVSIIEDTTWGEYTMTWSNKPAHGEIIASGVISSEGYYLIDVTDYIESRNNLSICIYCTDPGLDDWIHIDSKESADAEDRPRLIWTSIATGGGGGGGDGKKAEAELDPILVLIYGSVIASIGVITIFVIRDRLIKKRDIKKKF